MKAVIALVIMVCALLGADKGADVKAELKALEGTWKAVSMEAAGQQLPMTGMEFTYIVTADGKAIGKSARGDYEATITVDPSKDPRTIVNAHTTGTHKNKKQYGVYKLDGDKWTVAMTAPGAAESDWPKDFETKGRPVVVFVFERVREQKKP